MRKTSLLVLLLLVILPLHAAETLTVASGGPQGEIASLAEASEIRITFSEPMVVLGKIPATVTAPFFKITPAVKGAFRWSGTTTLLFTPDAKSPLPYATTYTVTIDKKATSINGNTLAQPYTFSFTTPTVRLQSTQWYRKDGRFDTPLLIALRFNQPVKSEDVAAHLKMNYVAHEWKPPTLTKAQIARMNAADPQAVPSFQAKVARTEKAVAATGPVFSNIATDWDKKRWPASPDLVVFETQPNIPTDSWFRIILDAELPSPAGTQKPGMAQEYTIQMPPTFFVDNFDCTQKCEPDYYNPIRLRQRVSVDLLAKALTVTDITNPKKETNVKIKPADKAAAADGDAYEEEDSEYESGYAISLEEAGVDHPPAKTYAARIAPTLQSEDGQTLGYTWVGIAENWHRFAFTSFGDGHGVWENSGGTQLPFYARNFKNVTQYAVPIDPSDLMPRINELQGSYFRYAPAAGGVDRKLGGKADKVESYGLDMSPALQGRKSGLLVASVREGEPIAKARISSNPAKSTVVQVTNLGINVKDSPQNTLVFVTTLDTGQPVSGANVKIINRENKALWSGRTDGSGLALAPSLPLRDPDNYWMFQFIVTAEKDGDVAYVASDWNEGVAPYEFGNEFNLEEARPILRGEVFTDRGVYKLGEEVHLKAIIRSDTPDGMKLLPANTDVKITVTDSQDGTVDTRTVKLGTWSSSEWTMEVPDDGPLGYYTVNATIDGQNGDITQSFLVAAYRRPDFRVDVTLTGDSLIAGDPLTGTITGRYLFGGTMPDRSVEYLYSKRPFYTAPPEVLNKFPQDRWTFIGCCDRTGVQEGEISSAQTTLDNKGVLTLKLDTMLAANIPYEYRLEGDVEDISRQKIANRNTVVVHPAPWYIGIKEIPYFVEAPKGLDTEFIAVSPEGVTVPNVPIKITLTQIQWNSVRRSEGGGFYTWETERVETKTGEWSVTSRENPVPLHLDLPRGGYYVLRATAGDDRGRTTSTETSFYGLGAGYTAWARYDHNRIDLVPEKKWYAPGDEARIMIQSPWESAVALVTTEREGVKTYRQFALTSTQQTITVPIREEDIPNIYVSVLLVKGRTDEAATEDASDPGKPTFRLGYTKLGIVDWTKRLDVTVKSNKEEYRPANKAKVLLEVRDHQKKPVQAEVTLWAVDYGVLSLTDYQTPEIIDSIYLEKALQVMNEDNRQRIISRRVLTPKGGDEGGGGGEDSGPSMLRKDFRVLAFWIGSVVTNNRGQASVEVQLPESLTTYRIMAVAADKVSRFGSADSEIRINKPLLLAPNFPRFMAVGDKALFGAVVHNQLKKGGNATVTIKSLDPNVLALTGEGKQQLRLTPGQSTEVRFPFEAKGVGRARIQMTVKMGRETDGLEESFPVEILVSPETVAAYGTAKPDAREILQIPEGVVPNYGGLHLELASTAMVGLGEGARYLVEYPYGCAEQRSSRAIALMLTADLGDAFTLPGINPAELKTVVATTLDELQEYQCGDGGFGFWPDSCPWSSPYLTAYIVHVYQVAKKLGYSVPDAMLQNAYTYLETELGKTPPTNEGWMPSYTAWQTYAVKVLTEGGRNQESNINRLYQYLDRMPIFAITYLSDSLAAKGEKGKRFDELQRRIRNSILQEAGSAHVEELSDPNLLWFWNSNVRSTAIVLGSIVRNTSDEVFVRGLVRWLLAVRKDGRWRNTQENALALEALVDYYRKYESEVPDFIATAALGQEELARETFKGRSTVASEKDLPMTQLLTKAPAGTELPLTFHREGTGTLFYTARLRYTANMLFQQGLDAGFRVERSYVPMDGGEATTNYKAGDMIRVNLVFYLTKERRYVAVTDPLPAGFEPVESWFATTASDMVRENEEAASGGSDWMDLWRRGGFDHIERHDDRVNLFATRLSEGEHTFSYIARATTAGTFRTAPTYVEEMYEPEIFGRTATAVVEVKP